MTRIPIHTLILESRTAMIFNVLHRWQIILLAGFSIILTACYEEGFYPEEDLPVYSPYLTFNDIQVAADTVNRTMLCSVAPQNVAEWNVSLYSTPFTVMEIEGKPLGKKGDYTFLNIETTRNYRIKVRTEQGDIQYFNLQFTTFPVIQIFTKEEIPEEPKCYAWIIISDAIAEERNIKSHAGIEYRGGSGSPWHPKRSYALEFWNDEDESGQRNISFFGLMEDDDWILDAMYRDKARMRKAVSFQIWKEMQADLLPDLQVRKTWVDGGYVEVFENAQYKGLFYLSERIDRKRLDIWPPVEKTEGVIYKAEDWQDPTLYTGMYDTTGGEYWGGWELKYPSDRGNEAWHYLYTYIDFVVHSPDSVFSENIFGYVNQLSLIDYYILLNASLALDNSGKNIILTKYNSHTPFVQIPWDLDATWGRSFNGEFSPSDTLLTNNLYQRLISNDPYGFRENLKSRWTILRNDILKEENICTWFDYYKSELSASGAIDREAQLWDISELNLDEEIPYIKGWTLDHLEYLDEYFNSLGAVR
jgi:spore coat protein H